MGIFNWSLARFHDLCSADIPVGGFTGLSSPVFTGVGSGDWKVASLAGRKACASLFPQTLLPVSDLKQTEG
jgi:hypothetical protein